MDQLSHDCLDVIREYLTRNDILRLRAVCKDLHAYVDSLHYYWRGEFQFTTKPHECMAFKFCKKPSYECIVRDHPLYWNRAYKVYYSCTTRNICEDLKDLGAFTSTWMSYSNAYNTRQNYYACECSDHNHMYCEVNPQLLRNAVEELLKSDPHLQCWNGCHKKTYRKKLEIRKRTKHNYIQKIARHNAKKAVKSWTPHREQELKELIDYRDRAASADELLKIIGSK